MHISGARTRRLAGIALWVATITAASALSAQSPSGKSFLWKVHSGSKLVYLAGSVHALSADVYPLSPAFEQAFSASGTLVEEIDLGETEMLAAAPAILAKGMYLDGRRFDSVVSKETAALVNARLKDSGLPVEMFQAMKPWMVMLTVAALDAQKAGLDPTLGLDKHFYDRAKAAGKGIIGLETAESQIDRLDAMSSDLQQYPAAYRSLIVERNQNWIPQIDMCLSRPQPCLVVVGAAHLVGPDGLLTMLQRKGYKIEQQ